MLVHLQAWDLLVLSALYGGDTHGPWLWLMVALTWLGNGWNMLWLLPWLMVPRTRRPVLVLLGALLTTAAAVSLLKALFRRPRPCMTLHHVHRLWDAPHNFSLPSGHAAGSFAFVAFLSILLLARNGWRKGSIAASLGLFALAAAVGLSRVYLGVHYPTDVLAGAALGCSIGAGAALWYMAGSERLRPPPGEQPS